jgi:Peptidase_C39 like family
MRSTPTTHVATTARLGVLAVLVGAAVAAALIGSVGPARAAPKAPAPNTSSGMHGDPAAAAPYWRYQQQRFDCAEMAIADVIGEISGHLPTEDEITGTAADIPSASRPGPIYSGGKTSNKDLVPLLAHYGIPADAVHPSTSDTLVRRLDQGRKIVVGVNDKILWDTPGDRSRENHFVVVIGIDTNANVVHVNDSGVEAGRDEQVSAATFEAAWAAADNFTVVTS